VSIIGLSVIQISPTEAELKFYVDLPPGTSAPPANAPAAGVIFAPALGTSFLNCPAPNCTVIPGPQPASEWGKFLAFSAKLGRSSS
jgi:hypothetical protein